VGENLRSQDYLKSTGPHVPATARRRLVKWSTLAKRLCFESALASPAPKLMIRVAPPSHGAEEAPG